MTSADFLLLKQSQARRNAAEVRYQLAKPEDRETRLAEYTEAVASHRALLETLAPPPFS